MIKSTALKFSLALFCLCNTSCYTMIASGGKSTLAEDKITEKNTRVARYQSVVKLVDFDLDAKQFQLQVLKYPIVVFDEIHEKVYRKNNFGQAFSTGSTVYGSIAGILLILSLPPSASTRSSVTLSSSDRQATLVGAVAVTGLALIDLLVSSLQYIPMTKNETLSNVERESKSELTPVSETMIQVKDSETDVVLHSGVTTANGIMYLSAKTFSLDFDSKSDYFKNNKFTISYYNNEKNSDVININELVTNLDKEKIKSLNLFKEEQSKYAKILEYDKNDEFSKALKLVGDIDLRYLFSEQKLEIASYQSNLYKKQYDNLITLSKKIDERSIDRQIYLDMLISKAKDIPISSPFYNKAQSDISNWDKKLSIYKKELAAVAEERRIEDAYACGKNLNNSNVLYKSSSDVSAPFWAAVNCLKSIPKSSEYYQDAQNRIKKLQKATHLAARNVSFVFNVQENKRSYFSNEKYELKKNLWGDVYVEKIPPQEYQYFSNAGVDFVIDNHNNFEFKGIVSIHRKAEGGFGMFYTQVNTHICTKEVRVAPMQRYVGYCFDSNKRYGEGIANYSYSANLQVPAASFLR